MKKLGLALALGLLSFGALAQDKPVDLKISIWVPPAHPLVPATQDWADDDQEGLGRHHQGDDLPVRAARQGVRPLRHGARRHRRLRLRQPGLPAGPLPGHRRRPELPFLFANAKGGTAAIDAWYRKYAAKEMKDVHFCFAFVHDPGTFHGRKKIVLPADIKGMKIRPAHEHDRPDGDAARRHQRAGLGARGARRAGARRGRRDHLPVGLDRPVRHRQGR